MVGCIDPGSHAHACAHPPPLAGEGGEGAQLAPALVASPSRPPPQAGEGRSRRKWGAKKDFIPIRSIINGVTPQIGDRISFQMKPTMTKDSSVGRNMAVR